MTNILFQTVDGIPVPAVTEDQMREVDRLAVEEFNLGILQMMENAGRTLADCTLAMLGGLRGTVTILAGPGGNGGGGICAARHLYNRGIEVRLILASEVDDLRGPAQAQYSILKYTDLKLVPPGDAASALRDTSVVLDALLGYSLKGAPHGRTKELIKTCNRFAPRVLSLDIPSGRDATTGDAPGIAVDADRTLTLALPKTGLAGLPGELYLADIGIPPEVYHRLDLHFKPFFGTQGWLKLIQVNVGNLPD